MLNSERGRRTSTKRQIKDYLPNTYKHTMFMKPHGKKVHQENRGYLMTWKEKERGKRIGFQIPIMVTGRNKDKSSFALLCTLVEIYVRWCDCISSALPLVWLYILLWQSCLDRPYAHCSREISPVLSETDFQVGLVGNSCYGNSTI